MNARNNHTSDVQKKNMLQSEKSIEKLVYASPNIVEIGSINKKTLLNPGIEAYDSQQGGDGTAS